MRKILFLIVPLLVMASSCSDFLEKTPISEPNVEDFFKTESDILNGVIAAYSTLQSGDLYGGRDLMDLTEYRGDIAFDNDPSASSGIRFNLDRFIEGSTNEIIEDVWQRTFQAIYRCNVVLDNIEEVEMDQALRTRSIGELRFIRALMYFNAVQIWGELPVITTADDTETSRLHERQPVSEVYALIESDLQFGAQNLPSDYPAGEIGRATSGAAEGLLGKVYLTQQKWAEAQNALNNVINSRDFQLMPTIAEVFDPQNEFNAEIVFAVVFTAEDPAFDHGYFFGSGIGDNIDPTFRARYDENDARVEMIELVVPEGTATVVPKKYFEPLSAFGGVGTDFPVLRYADILLMYAEALNELGYAAGGEAFDALNDVRTRAGLSAYTASDLPDQASFRDAVFLERTLEFPLEGFRWFDLIRTGRVNEFMNEVSFPAGGIDVPDFRLVFPVPNSQIQVYNNPTGFPQNTGY